MVKFETIFWRQVSAVILTTIAYTSICGDITAVIGPLFMFFLILGIQEYAIDKIKRRKKYAVAGRNRKEAA